MLRNTGILRVRGYPVDQYRYSAIPRVRPIGYEKSQGTKASAGSAGECNEISELFSPCVDRIGDISQGHSIKFQIAFVNKPFEFKRYCPIQI